MDAMMEVEAGVMFDSFMSRVWGTSQEGGQHLDSGRGKEMDFPYSLQEEVNPRASCVCNSMKSTLDFRVTDRRD